jgi:lipoate-protein ligase A
MSTLLQRWKNAGWELLRETACSPALNLALDQVLVRQVAEGRRRPTLRFWGWASPAVVIGRFQSLRNEVDLEAAGAMGIEVVRRMSGGGAMFVQPGKTITYSLYLLPDLVEGLSIKDSYELCDRWVVEALGALGVEAWYMPLNDIAGPQGKIGGAAQARRPHAVLHHTTIAYEMHEADMRRVLRIGRPRLSNRGTPSAAKQVSPLRNYTGLSREAIVDYLIDAFRRSFGLTEGSLCEEITHACGQLVQDRYGSDHWINDLP